MMQYKKTLAEQLRNNHITFETESNHILKQHFDHFCAETNLDHNWRGLERSLGVSIDQRWHGEVVDAYVRVRVHMRLQGIKMSA